jgi:hypothetical protein
VRFDHTNIRLCHQFQRLQSRQYRFRQQRPNIVTNKFQREALPFYTFRYMGKAKYRQQAIFD